MVRNFVCLSLLALTSCGGAIEADPAFSDRIAAWQSEKGFVADGVIVTFSDDLTETRAGVCLKGFGKKNVVRVSRKRWAQLSPGQKTNLIFHELGHCVLDLPHDDRRKNNNCPASEMHSAIMTDFCFFELFPNTRGLR